jgi:hypothetical protein
MKSNAVAAIGIALIDLPLAVKPDPLFQIACTEMKAGAGAALAAARTTEPARRPTVNSPHRGLGD